MIFGLFGGGKSDQPDDEEEMELVAFQGALNGKAADLKANARLVEAGLVPAKEMVSEALSRRAEMIRLETKGDRAAATLFIDGVAYAGQRYPRQQATAIVQMIKLLAGLDHKLKGRPQEGGLKAEYTELPYEIRVEVTPVAEGQERLVLKFRNLKEKMSTPEELGIPPETKQKLRDVCGGKHGLVLVVGPPFSGVTTTYYGLLRGIDVYLHAAFTIAAPSDRDVYNISRFEVNEGDSFEQTCRRMIRSEADIISVDPLRDGETAKTLLELAENVCFICEMPAKDSGAAIEQLVKWTSDPQLVSTSLDAIFSPKLIRKLCTECREAFRPNPKLLTKMGLPDDLKVMYRKGEPPTDPKTGEVGEPCARCDGVGYLGRTVMLEVLEITPDIRELIAKGAPPDQIKAKARAEGQTTFQKEGLRLVAEGITSLEELQRVFKAG